jgi:hypothetical protein
MCHLRRNRPVPPGKLEPPTRCLEGVALLKGPAACSRRSCSAFPVAHTNVIDQRAALLGSGAVAPVSSFVLHPQQNPRYEGSGRAELVDVDQDDLTVELVRSWLELSEQAAVVEAAPADGDPEEATRGRGRRGPRLATPPARCRRSTRRPRGHARGDRRPGR